MSEAQELKAGTVVAITAGMKQRPALPAALADVALVDAETAAAVGDMSVSWWLSEVTAKRAPAPAIREIRCTRWKLVAVREFWIKRIELAALDTDSGAVLTARAKKAAAASNVKRQAMKAQAQGVAA